ncbi:MAG: recombination mediator RecR [Thermodesulfobacteriota bacterium]
MAGNAYPAALRRVIAGLSRWPGVGEKTASRMAMHLLRAPEAEVLELANALMELKEKIQLCRRCFAFADQEFCPICANPARSQGQILVVAEPGDLLAIEKVGWYQGLYHVLGGLISPLEGVGPDDIRIMELLDRVMKEGIKEVILGLNPSLEGETTTTYLGQELKPLGVKVTRIAYGLPMGGEIKYADQQTLRESLSHRVEA